jgi:hypothetical protein
LAQALCTLFGGTVVDEDEISTALGIPLAPRQVPPA